MEPSACFTFYEHFITYTERDACAGRSNETIKWNYDWIEVYKSFCGRKYICFKMCYWCAAAVSYLFYLQVECSQSVKSSLAHAACLGLSASKDELWLAATYREAFIRLRTMVTSSYRSLAFDSFMVIKAPTQVNNSFCTVTFSVQSRRKVAYNA